MSTIRVVSTHIEPDRRSGNVMYELHDGEAFRYMRQPFRLGPSVREGDRLFWSWDGTEPITLTPSFRCDNGREHVHLFLVRGAIQLCSDSTVVLA